jgi:hypothetical protein
MLDVATAAGSVLAAFGLSGAAGLNAWIPLLAMGVLGRVDFVELAEPYDALATDAGIATLAVLFALDFIGDKIPAVDSLLHAAGSIVAPLSGAILFAGQTEIPTEIPEVVALALGATVAGSLHATRAVVRPASTTLTGGAGNPVLSFGEDLTSAGLTATAFFVPILGALLLVAVGVAAWAMWRRVLRLRRPSRR